MKTNICLFLAFMLFFSSCTQDGKKSTETMISQKDSLKMPAASGNDGDVRAQDTIVTNTGKFKKFEGAWFDIEYPENFTATGSEKSATSDGFDSAIFTSPDGKVQFYVYSPQWNGAPKDIAMKDTEVMADAKDEIAGNMNSVKRWTYQAKDGSYSRSYEQTSGK